jgi:hypothetical protein
MVFPFAVKSGLTGDSQVQTVAHEVASVAREVDETALDVGVEMHSVSFVVDGNVFTITFRGTLRDGPVFSYGV